jgi:hypothetical protein
VVYRELFTRGLTVLDVVEGVAPPRRLSGSSHTAAQGEVQALLDLVATRSAPTH